MRRTKTRKEQAGRIQRILNKIDYAARPGLFFSVGPETAYDKATRDKTPYSERGLVLWVTDWVINVDTGKSGRQVGRRWAIDPRSDADNVIRLAFEALTRFEAHETGEWFKYKGEKIFNPHKRIL